MAATFGPSTVTRWWTRSHPDHGRTVHRALGSVAASLPAPGVPQWAETPRVLVHVASRVAGSAAADIERALLPSEAARFFGVVRAAGAVIGREGDFGPTLAAAARVQRQRARLVHASAGVGNWIGSLAPGGLLVVGDRRSDSVARRWSKRPWPWFSSAGASRLLLRSLALVLGPRGPWSACNAWLDDGTAVDLERAVEVLEPAGVLALGREAAMECRRQRVRATEMQHPAHWVRFHRVDAGNGLFAAQLWGELARYGLSGRRPGRAGQAVTEVSSGGATQTGERSMDEGAGRPGYGGNSRT